jgi:hypothetical protein
VVTEPGNSAPVQITWNSSANSNTYKWFLTTAAGTFTAPLLVLPANGSGTDTTLTLTSGGIDAILASLNISQADSVKTKWTVFAYRGTDSLQAAQVFNITLARKKISTGAFSLISPSNNSSLEVEEGSPTQVVINWGKSTNSNLYRWFVTSSTGTFNAPLLRINSSNNGTDTSLILTSGTLDNVLNSLGVKRGASTNLKWTVYAYLAGDSLKAGQDWNITLARKRVLSAFNLTAPNNNARVEVAKNSTDAIVINWTASNKAANYRWKATIPAGNFNIPLLNLPSLSFNVSIISFSLQYCLNAPPHSLPLSPCI